MAAQLRTATPAQWNRTRDDIVAEADLQRRLLQEGRGALDPAVVKAKQALLGGQEDGQGQSAETPR